MGTLSYQRFSILLLEAAFFFGTILSYSLSCQNHFHSDSHTFANKAFILSDWLLVCPMKQILVFTLRCVQEQH